MLTLKQKLRYYEAEHRVATNTLRQIESSQQRIWNKAVGANGDKSMDDDPEAAETFDRQEAREHYFRDLAVMLQGKIEGMSKELGEAADEDDDE